MRPLTLTFGEIDELGDSDTCIPNPDLPEMEADTLEELPLPKCMSRKASDSKQMDNTVGRGFFFQISTPSKFRLSSFQVASQLNSELDTQSADGESSRH